MNHRVPPFDQKEVRDAVNFAVDSNALARLFGGRLEPTCSFLPPNMPGFEERECPWGDPAEPGDIARARQMIEEAGVAGDRVQVYTNNDENRPEIGQYYTDLLNKIGFDAELTTLDGGVYFQTIGSAKERAQTGFANWFQDFPHPYNFLFLMSSTSIQPTNSVNYGNVSNPELDEQFDIVNSGSTEDSKVTEAAAAADELVIENAHVAPYGSEKLATFFSERMDFENCAMVHPLYQNDYSSWCLK